MPYNADPDQFAQFELEARSLLFLLESGENPDLTVFTQTLGGAVEFMLCDVFGEHDATFRYWVDGVLIHAVYLQPGRRILLNCQAWCADDRTQWLVPAQILVGCLDGPESVVSLLTVRIGDAAFATLDGHRDRKKGWVGEPESWLFEFELQRPVAPLPLSVEPFVVQLHDWTSANATRPVVGPDWEPLTHDQAIQYIQSQAAEGRPITFVETWLDGGPALRIE